MLRSRLSILKRKRTFYSASFVLVRSRHPLTRDTARFDRHDITDQIDAPESREPREQNDPTASSEPKLPIEPIESAEPTDPMESTEFFEAMERKEPSEAIDHRDGNRRPFRTLVSGVIGVNSARRRIPPLRDDW
jgi:hypothetical protein